MEGGRMTNSFFDEISKLYSKIRAPQKAGIVAIFKRPDQLIRAAKKIRENKITKFDCFTPYPIHGLDHAMGLKRSWIPWVAFVMGLVGCIAGFGMQYWMSVVDWPLNVGGKPLNSWPAFIPITFEVTVLFAGVATVVALFFVCRIPKIDPVIFDERITNDKFALFVSQDDKQYEAGVLETLFQELGAEEVKKIDA
jgi:hypothetical protein